MSFARSLGTTLFTACFVLVACGHDELLALGDAGDASLAFGGGAGTVIGGSGGSVAQGGSGGGVAAAGGLDSGAEAASGGQAGAVADASLDTGADAITDGGGWDALAEIAPDFHLVDVNTASATYDQSVSPRDYLGQVSAWYFGHST